MKQIALLSNVNISPVIRMLQKNTELSVFAGEGYGNVLGQMMNPSSGYRQFGADITFLLLDIQELTDQTVDPVDAKKKMQDFLNQLQGVLSGSLAGQGVFYIADAYAWSTLFSVSGDKLAAARLENLWNEQLETLCKNLQGVRVFPYHKVISALGEAQAFSEKMWYLGGIPHTMAAQQRLAEEVNYCVELEKRTPKKVLVLDLDNTLWGGIAGEHEITPIVLAGDHGGLPFKNLQRMILQMKREGVLLAIASKNNESDVLPLLREHPHMVLKEEDFAAMELCWDPKPMMLQRLAKKLNLGLDSFVFFDDAPVEREAVKQMLPMVEVPDFPATTDKLPETMQEIYKAYFAKSFVTAEDLGKTEQYQENAKREALRETAGSFEDYLESLQMEIVREPAEANFERMLQLFNKTNQFNLMTQRHSQEELQELLADNNQEFFLYRVKDRFGDNGIVAALRVEYDEEAHIREFVMSCRVMGRDIEKMLVQDVCEAAKVRGCQAVKGYYLHTPKNQPVEELYDRLGFERCMSNRMCQEYRCEL